MKLALIAVISCLALSVKSASYVKAIGAPNSPSYDYTPLPYTMYKNFPVIDVLSFDLVCRTPDMSVTTKPFSTAAGSTIRVVWETLELSPYSKLKPYGPCSFWLAPYSSKGEGKVWSKIQEITIEETSKGPAWCSAFIQELGYRDVVIPKGIAPGKYYLRSEVIDLDGARGKSYYQDYTSGARYHVNCNLIEITGKGTASLKSPVSILEAYQEFHRKPLFPSTMKNGDLKMPGGPSPYAKK
ncbi:hypothetical protein GGI10_006385 [Coemansia sp. RSA 2530]|nr:hypothetical protein GGI06_000843 [Coemansia sp. S85]KAJ2399534.1 hypothetical protein GGI10_006385 [Coemansia sp. RSA 2530]